MKRRSSLERSRPAQPQTKARASALMARRHPKRCAGAGRCRLSITGDETGTTARFQPAAQDIGVVAREPHDAHAIDGAAVAVGLLDGRVTAARVRRRISSRDGPLYPWLPVRSPARRAARRSRRRQKQKRERSCQHHRSRCVGNPCRLHRCRRRQTRSERGIGRRDRRRIGSESVASARAAVAFGVVTTRAVVLGVAGACDRQRHVRRHARVRGRCRADRRAGDRRRIIAGDKRTRRRRRLVGDDRAVRPHRDGAHAFRLGEIARRSGGSGAAPVVAPAPARHSPRCRRRGRCDRIVRRSTGCS